MSALTVRMLIIVSILAVSVGAVASAVSAKDQDGTKPGWGYGDPNHDHTGPPGQSVNPGKNN
jgi:hypothetical protein